MRTAKEAAEKPMPGDRWEYGPQWQLETMTIDSFDGKKVHYRTGFSGTLHSAPINEWQDWMATATFLGGAR